MPSYAPFYQIVYFTYILRILHTNNFTNIAPTSADKIKTTNSYTDYMQNQLPINLVMEKNTCAEIINIIQNIKSMTSTGFDNISTQLMKNSMDSPWRKSLIL